MTTWDPAKWAGMIDPDKPLDLVYGQDGRASLRALLIEYQQLRDKSAHVDEYHNGDSALDQLIIDAAVSLLADLSVRLNITPEEEQYTCTDPTCAEREAEPDE